MLLQLLLRTVCEGLIIVVSMGAGGAGGAACSTFAAPASEERMSGSLK
jgi:hypothetical protein